MNPRNINIKKPLDFIDFLFKEERRSSVVLLISAVLAVALANSGWSQNYFDFFDTYWSLGGVNLDVQHWISEGLMAIFFLVVGLEIKREFTDGELSSWRKASFPVVGALGGMLVPALIFSLFNPSSPQNAGWAIPMATDIALALGVIGLLGKRISKSVRIFLLTLAVIDDIASILVISLFYTQPDNMVALILAVILAVGLLVVRKNKFWPYLFFVGGILIWYLVLLAGISATLAGVAIAMLIPLQKNNSKLNSQPVERLESFLIPITSFVIVPLFVFSNAGISFSNLSLQAGGSFTVFMGVMLGLFIGKPIGILGAIWFGKVAKIIDIPKSISWNQLLGISLIAGIGFTVSLLITSIAYKDLIDLKNAATLGVFSGSLLSATAGLYLLSKNPKPSKI